VEKTINPVVFGLREDSEAARALTDLMMKGREETANA
jgi:hypothetical protein